MGDLYLPEVDCLASSEFHQLAKYYSLHLDPAEGCLLCPEVARQVVCFPPHPIPMALEKIRQDNCKVILLVPLWRSSKWLDMLIDLLLNNVLHLGDHRAVLDAS